jgi:hypothetical protein
MGILGRDRPETKPATTAPLSRNKGKRLRGEMEEAMISENELKQALVWARVAHRAVEVDDFAALSAQVPKVQLREALDGLREAVRIFAALANLCADGHAIFEKAEVKSGLRVIRPSL